MKHPNEKSYNWLIYRINESFFKKYQSLIKGTVLDFGCGDKPYEKIIMQTASGYIGLDWGNTFHNLKADIVADLNKEVPVDSNTVDTVISISVIEHLINYETMLKETFRVLKPGGYFILQVPWQWWIHEAPYDYFRFTPHSLKLVLSRAGYKNIKIEAGGGFFTTIVLKLNYFGSRFVEGSRFRRFIVRPILIPCWYISQKLAPLLDKLDDSWELETTSYWITCKKSVD